MFEISALSKTCKGSTRFDFFGFQQVLYIWQINEMIMIMIMAVTLLHLKQKSEKIEFVEEQYDDERSLFLVGTANKK